MALSNGVLPKLVLPSVFFAYAFWVSGSFVAGANQFYQDLPTDAASVIEGHFTAELEATYKDRLPYRMVSTDLVGAARYLVFGEGRKGVVVGSEGWLFSSEEYRTAADETLGIAEATRTVGAVRDRLAAMGSTLVVVPLPGKADIYREHTAYPSLSQAMASRYEQFRAALAAEGISTVDARSAMLDGKDDVQVFLRGDTHWSPQGAAIVAAATAQVAGAMVAPKPFALTAGDTLLVDGDLTKFIVSPQYASHVSLAPEQVTLLHAAPEASAATPALDLFGEQAIEVALVGTSYSANEHWSFAPSLMSAMGADIVNFAEEGQGPFRPMRAYLQSDLATQTPPRLVIWEIPVRYLTDPAARMAMPPQEDDSNE